MTHALHPLPPFTNDGGPLWTKVLERLADRPFLRSEGVSAPLAPPRIADEALVAQSRRVVETFHRYYRAVVDAGGEYAARPPRRIGEPYETIADAEGDRDPLPLARLDCVLDAEGRLRVIELNPVGVCTLHLRGVAYLARTLSRMGQGNVAQSLASLGEAKAASIRRFCAATLTHAAPHTATSRRPTLAIVRLPNMHRGSFVFWRAELEAGGFDVVSATPAELTLDDAGAHVGTGIGARRVDALWCDWLVYLGYQQRRYEQTKFASKMGDYSRASELTDHLLGHPALPALLQQKKLTLISPIRAYRALSKALLAEIHREGPVLPLSPSLSGDDWAFLRAHVARTWDDRDRGSVLSLDDARRLRDALVLKPCRFGGSHGVVLGRTLAPEAWARRLDETWTDPEWVLQEVSEPIRDAAADQAARDTGSRDHTAGDRLSFGLYDYGGELGGILVRGAPDMVVSARTASVFPAVFRPQFRKTV